MLVVLNSVRSFFFFNDTATTEIYTLSLHDALPRCWTKLRSICGMNSTARFRPSLLLQWGSHFGLHLSSVKARLRHPVIPSSRSTTCQNARSRFSWGARVSCSSSLLSCVPDKRFNGWIRSFNMHVRKANDELWKLTSAPASLETFITAAALLDGLDKANEDANSGERTNGTVSEKIQGARHWFEILCGIGEDGDWSEERLRDLIGRDLSVIGQEIEGSSFKRWPAVESTD